MGRYRLVLSCIEIVTLCVIATSSQSIFDRFPSVRNMFSSRASPAPPNTQFRSFSNPFDSFGSQFGTPRQSPANNAFSSFGQPSPRNTFRSPVTVPSTTVQPSPPTVTPPPVTASVGGLFATRTPTGPPTQPSPSATFIQNRQPEGRGDLFQNFFPPGSGNTPFLGRSPAPQPPVPVPAQQGGGAVGPPPETIAAIRAEAREFILTNDEWLPNLVQLVFHTCIGGCDGCLNFAEKDNRGLDQTYAHIRERWATSLGNQLTLADYIVLLGTEAAEIAMSKTDGGLRKVPQIPFTAGRNTCRDPEDYTVHHEFPQGDHLDSVTFLMTNFGLSRNHAIALLGAHSLGACRMENTGFAGRWTNTPLVLDNHYYKSLSETPQWSAVPISGTWQWNSTEPNGPMMLHADMILLKQFTVDPVTGEPSCKIHSGCGIGTDSGRVQLYASSINVWADDFIQAFVQMVSKRPTSRH